MALLGDVVVSDLCREPGDAVAQAGAGERTRGADVPWLVCYTLQAQRCNGEQGTNINRSRYSCAR